MSKSTTMLRTRRRDNNVKPNRRLDRKSSRGMIYENEELRLRTININAEIERGQYDIKKLKRENEMLKKEIWCLRDEYDKLDKLLKEKEYDFSSSSSTTCSSSESESCSSCTEELDEVETSQNLQNVQKTNMKNLHAEFDHLSVVQEENSTENSDKNSNRASIPNDQWNNECHIIKPDQSYPTYDKASTLPSLPPKNFFSPIKMSKSNEEFYTSEKVVNTNATNFYQNMVLVPKVEEIPPRPKTATDLIVKTDNQPFNGTSSRSTFSNGGNLEELLNDIETISQDILKITNDQANLDTQSQKPYKSELSVVLMPNPMPLLGFDKYRNIKDSFESLHSKSAEKLSQVDESLLTSPPVTSPPLTSPPLTSASHCERNPFFFGPVSDTSSDFFNRYNPDNPPMNPTGSKSNLLELTSSELISSENEENLKFQTSKLDAPPEKKSPKLSIRRKVSIHFKGKRDRSAKPTEKKHSLFDIKFGEPKHQKTPSLESRKSTTDAEPKTPTSSDSKTGSDRKKDEKKPRKSVSVSPDRKHVHVKDDKKHKKHRKNDRAKNRRGTITSVDRMHRERSFSVCTDRSLEHKLGGLYDDFGEERERTNSVSSCETVKTRKMSNISNIPLSGKVPWCACWGNGCI